ncbi:TlpA family protein disulfide reductase [Nocardioides coralli]|uniref:TlpA family protein disulfide reductase n=1 Tax=Nocardioides coralli TaxID=2872154 RepID=UPI001CA40B33|nr:thioredoxin family protein [Nocardioides coralli]QZY28799.1 thioredoxin family protein [Nocardioides coralli]
MTTGAWVLVASLLLVVAVALWRGFTDGRFRGTHRVRGLEQSPADAAPPAGTPAPAGTPVPEVEVQGRAGSPEVEVRGRPAPEPRNHRPSPEDPILSADQLGERATLLQFSSAFCAPCRATRRVLHDVAETVPGVTHVEIDAEHHLDLVRRVGVRRTPTTLVLDAAGNEVTRAAGAPRREQVLAALARTEA